MQLLSHHTLLCHALNDIYVHLHSTKLSFAKIVRMKEVPGGHLLYFLKTENPHKYPHLTHPIKPTSAWLRDVKYMMFHSTPRRTCSRLKKNHFKMKSSILIDSLRNYVRMTDTYLREFGHAHQVV
jgi:hypothetical protein